MLTFIVFYLPFFAVLMGATVWSVCTSQTPLWTSGVYFIIFLFIAVCAETFYRQMEAGARPGDQRFFWQVKMMWQFRLCSAMSAVGAALLGLLWALIYCNL